MTKFVIRNNGSRIEYVEVKPSKRKAKALAGELAQSKN